MSYISLPRLGRAFGLSFVAFGLLSALSVACGVGSDDYMSDDSDVKGRTHYGYRP